MSSDAGENADPGETEVANLPRSVEGAGHYKTVGAL